MEKVAIVNITSFGREFPEHLIELKDKIGYVEKMSIPVEVTGIELANKLKGFKYVILGNYPTFDQSFFEHNSEVKLIARQGLGFNNIDLKEAKKHHVYVTCVPSKTEANAVAEQAVSLLCAVAKNIPKADRKVHKNEWNVNRQEIVGFQFFDRTTGIIGCGNIGRRFAQIMKDGFHNKILAYDPYLPKSIADEYGIELVDLDTLLNRSDFISLHANLTEENYHMISYEQINKTKKSAILINTSRGALIDEQAIYDAVENNKIYGYGADVTEHEPIESFSPLLKSNNIVITPHSATYNLTSMKAMNRKVMEDVYLVSKGEKPINIVNGL